MTKTERITVNLLNVDITVQREVDPVRVNGIIADFNMDAIGVPVVNHRKNGSYHVIDGGHRVAALKQMDMGTEEIECLVYDGLTLAEEAKMFRQLNNTRTVHPIVRFRVRVVEGDPVAVALSEILSSYGWHVTNGSRVGGFSAVSAIERIYRGPKGNEQNAALVRTTLDIIGKSWGSDQAGVKAEILRGLAAVIKTYGGMVDQGKLVRELSNYSGGPRRLLGAARGLKDLRGGSVVDSMAETIVAMLNKGKQNRLPVWQDTRS
jgi:uncharacterized protein YjhX (UPF0386 family)